MPMPMYLKNFSLRMSFYRSGPIKFFCDFVKDMAPQKRFLLQKVDFIQLWALKAGGGGGGVRHKKGGGGGGTPKSKPDRV